MKYELSKDFAGHTQDVKAVTSFNDKIVLSVSRDTTLRAWDLKSPGGEQQMEDETIFTGHQKFVNCVKTFPPTTDNPEGLYLSGGSDKIINIFKPSQPEKPTFFLVGHEDNVVTLDVLPDGRVISGSWDKTARVWKDWTQQFTLRGHSHAVWAVKALSRNLIATGSADKTIRLWDSSSGKCLKVIQAHDDCVRGIDEIPGLGFVSCGNDSVIKVWNYEGDLVQELFGHTSFIYSVALIPGTTDCFVSGGEDRSVRIWKGGVCVQSITLPAISVWSVAALNNGDVVCGSNDGHVRVFTQDASRKANAAQIEIFEASVAAQAVPSNQVGDINKDQLPDASALLSPGNKEGEVRMVRSGAIVEAHQWDSAAQQWQKIGEVVDAVGQGRKQLHDGKEYDYVFDINIDDGAPNLKLPYNVTENPYTAAMNFIQRNELPVSYIDQVAEFITTNTKGETLGVSAAPEQTYVDPYTGGSRYIAQQSTPSKQVASHRFPIREMLTFKQANVDAILTKLTQLNSTVPEPLRLDKGQIDALNKLAASSDSTSPGLEPLFKVITSWSASSRFPALDLLRYLTLNVPWYTTRPFASILESTTPEAAMNKDQDIIIMLSCRLISNLIAVSQDTVQKSLKDITRFMVNVGQQVNHLSPNARIAFFSALVNLSVMFTGKSGAAQDDDCIQWFLTAMSSLVSSLASPPATPAPSSHEANFRGLVAIGNMFTIHGQDGKDLAEISQLLPALSEIKLKKAEHDAKVSAIAEEIAHAFLI